MQELKGETTVFYSTHILDDVQRVSDHVAILDHGRLVKAAPTQVLLGSFTKNMLRVVARRRSARTPAAALAALAGRRPTSRSPPATALRRRTTSRLPRAASADVQRSITRFAVEAGLTLISNSEETLDLETVFLRLIDQKEVAA